MRNRLYRVAFYPPKSEEIGTLLTVAESVEFAISNTGRAVRDCRIHSVNPVFLSDDEEHDFLHFFIKGERVTETDIVDIKKRLEGVGGP